jgi:hypothetical protein
MRNALILAGVVVVAGYFGSKFYLHDKVTTNLDTVIAAVKPNVDIRYEGVSSTFSGELGIDGVTIRFAGFSDALHVDSVRIVTPGYFDLLQLADIGQSDFEMPESLAIAFRGVSVPVGADYFAPFEAVRAQALQREPLEPAAACTGRHGFSQEQFRELGYGTLLVDASFGYRTENGRFMLDFVNNVADMFDMAVTLTFDTVPTPQTVMMGAFQPLLVNGRMEYVDRSLEERVMKLCTERHGLPPEAVIAARKEAFQEAGGAMGIVFDEYVMGPYTEFLQGKDRFVMTAQPVEPGNLLQIGLYKPSDVPALLNLSAEVF